MRNILLTVALIVATLFIVGFVGLVTQGLPKPDKPTCLEVMRNKGYVPRSYDEHTAYQERVDAACR